jgi:myosin-6
VQKLSRKIQYRQENAIIVQSVIRAVLAIIKYRPRYRGIARLRQLEYGVSELNKLASKLKNNQIMMVEKTTKLAFEIDKEINNLKGTAVMKDVIDKEYDRLQCCVNECTLELKARQEQELVEEEERLKMKLLLEKQEEERIKRQKELELKANEEKKKIEEKLRQMEAKKNEYDMFKKQELSDKHLAQQTQLEIELELIAAEEQERRDFEIALRLAQSEHESQLMISSQLKSQQKRRQQTQATPQTKAQKQVLASIKSYDLTKWKFAELRDTINTSCDMKLLVACKDELHRRLQAYHSWRDRSTNQSDQRIPIQDVNQKSGGGATPLNTEQRYFRVPFIRPLPDDQENKSRGWWYAHFDGPWIARQLELHPQQPPLLLYAGIDDIEMCELRLEETGLTRKKGAEISAEKFEEIWNKYGGKPYTPPSTKL